MKHYPDWNTASMSYDPLKFMALIEKTFGTGNDCMPKKNQTILHLLDKYTNNTVVSRPTSEGVAFSQKVYKTKKMNTTTRRS